MAKTATPDGRWSPGRIVGCLCAWALVALSLAVAAWEVLAPNAAAGIGLRPAGELWYRLDVASLNLVQAVVERYIWPPLWDPAIAGLLQLPALLVFALPAVVLAAWCHRRRGGRGTFNRRSF